MDSVNIYPELQKPNKQGLSSIILRVDLNSKHVATEKLGQKISPKNWDPEAKEAKGHNADLINSILQKQLNRHKEFFLKRRVMELPINREVITRYINSNGAFECFYTFAEGVLKDKKLKDEGPYTEESKRRLNDELVRLKKYKPELSLKDITEEFLKNYKVWMQTVYEKKDKSRLHPNTIEKALAIIRMFYNEAIGAKIVLKENSPFATFKVASYEQNEDKIKYLELFEIEKLEQALLTKEMPELTRQVGWRFLAMCVSGMRISDATLLEDYFFNDAGDLEFKPYKTRRHENKAHIPITTERQRRYFKKTLTYSFSDKNPKNFRNTFNNHLKILAAMAGIRVDVTSHQGRHSMGSFLVDAGIETKPAMAMLGVKSVKTLEVYRHLKQSKLKSEANKLGNVM